MGGHGGVWEGVVVCGRVWWMGGGVWEGVVCGRCGVCVLLTSLVGLAKSA